MKHLTFVKMSSNLKKIAGYPESAINWSLGKLTPDERSIFESTLKKLDGFVGEKPKETKKITTKLPSNTEVFENHIIPTIMESLRKMDIQDNCGQVQTLQMDFNFKTDLNRISLDGLADIHDKVVRAEGIVQIVDNFLKYYRGLIYSAAHEQCDEAQFSKWIKSRSNSSQATVYRYMAFTAMIRRFPRLIMCDLNFSQILKHQGRLISYLGKLENSKLFHQLMNEVEFIVSGSKIIIYPTDCEVQPVQRLSFDADWRFNDHFQNVDITGTGITEVPTEGATNIEDESVKELEKYMTHV